MHLALACTPLAQTRYQEIKKLKAYKSEIILWMAMQGN